MKTQKLAKDERGFASFVVALTLILILALLVIGFAQLARREQQNALDKQLANQAYYAAESGVNDVVSGIRSGAITASDTSAGVGSNSCVNTSSLGLTPTIDSNNGVSYTCTIINMTPPSLNYNLKPGDSRSFTFSPNPAPATPTIALDIQWGSGDSPPQNRFPGSANASKFPTNTVWNTPGFGPSPPVLEVSVTPIGNTVNRSSLQTGTFTTYLYPSSAQSDNCPVGVAGSNSCIEFGVPANNPATQAPIVDGDCNNGRTTAPCSIVINGIPTSPAYLVHILDIYDSSQIFVTGNSNGTSFNFANAQDIIDVTGKARNVLKRIQVRVSPVLLNNAPSNAIQAQNVCKHFWTQPNGSTFMTANGSNTSSQPCGLDSP